MGGYERGEVASARAIETIREAFANQRPDDVTLGLKQAYRTANEAIFAVSEAHPDQGPLGTTLVSAIIHGKYVTIANVGDSRAYLMRADQITQITQDHTLVADQVAKGQLTAEQAKTSPQRNVVTHALGNNAELDRKMPSIYELTLMPEDTLLLLSDGFFDVVDDSDYIAALGTGDPQQSATDLVSLATERRTTDNVSAIIVSISASSATTQREVLSAEIAEQRPATNVQLIIVTLVVFALTVLVILGIVVFL